MPSSSNLAIGSLKEPYKIVKTLVNCKLGKDMILRGKKVTLRARASAGFRVKGGTFIKLKRPCKYKYKKQ